MKILIIGSGVVGVTSAYALVRRGHEVTVVDRASGPGRETSFANGTLLTPSMADPWNAPGSWRKLLASVGRADSAMQVRAGALLSLAGWGIQFLKNSAPPEYERNTRTNLQMALYSLQTMEALRRETNVRYGRLARGTLRVFRKPIDLERAQFSASRWAAEGLRHRHLSTSELVSLEPALLPVAGSLCGGIHYQDDESGDAHTFCVAMKEAAERCGARFLFRTEVRRLIARSGAVAEVVSTQQRLVADRYIIAAGSYSVPLARTVPLRLSIRPVKGYSVTFHCPEPLLRIPVVDDDLHAVVAPLEDAIRVAGTAEFCGYDLNLRRKRIRNLTTLLRSLLPQTRLDETLAKPWCGLRAMSSDGVPIIGSTPLSNLYLNTGHGHLGWTLAAGSAELLADLICKRRPAVDPTPFSLGRFSNC